ncbi:MAG: HEAT repeat domain-containing protein [Planctomycetes bacterium]|nr:HEAT repeat domain-containing protein [Planctomycetota bacterium]
MNQCDNVKLKLQDYLDGALSAEERLKTAEHLKSCIDCGRALVRIKQTDALLGRWEDVKPSADFLKTVNRRINSMPCPAPETPARRRYIYPVTAAAAILILVSILLFFFARNRRYDENQPVIGNPSAPPIIANEIPLASLQQGSLMIQSDKQQSWQEVQNSGAIKNNDTIKTENGEATLSLADKTQIEIGRNTVFKIRKPAAQDRGALFLQEGSIYLNVTTDTRPLFVETPEGRIKITGTALRVDRRTYSILPRLSTREVFTLLREGKTFSDTRIDIIVVAVDSGRVIIEYKDSPQELTAGERAAFSQNIRPLEIEVPASINTNEDRGLEKAVNYYLGVMGELSEKNDHQTTAIMEAILQSYGSRIAPHLLSLLKTKSNEIVNINHYKPVYTGRVIGRIGSEGLYGELEDIAGSSDYSYANRMAAACAIIAINQPRGGRIILDMLKNSNDIDTKRICIDGLKFWDKIGCETNSEFIKILLSTIKQGVAGNELFYPATKSLAGISDPAALEYLYEIFSVEQDYLTVIPVARSIFLIEGMQCYGRIIPKLNELAENDDDIVKLSVMKTIMEIEGPDAEARLLPRILSMAAASREIFVKFTALEVAHYFKYGRSVDIFMDILSAVSDNDRLLVQAIQKTAEFGTPEGIDVLAESAHRLIAEWMQTHQPEDEKAFTLILETLRQVNEPKTLPAFRRMLDDTDSDFVLSAVMAMAKMGEKSDIPALTQLLQSGGFDDYLQNEIMHAIDEIGKRMAGE